MNRDELLNDYNELKLLDAEKKDLIDLLFKKLGDRERLLRERGELIALLEEENADMLEVLKEIAEAKDILFEPYNNGLYFRDLVNKARKAIANSNK